MQVPLKAPRPRREAEAVIGTRATCDYQSICTPFVTLNVSGGQKIAAELR